jgi:hypothetical protein
LEIAWKAIVNKIPTSMQVDCTDRSNEKDIMPFCLLSENLFQAKTIHVNPSRMTATLISITKAM